MSSYAKLAKTLTSAIKGSQEEQAMQAIAKAAEASGQKAPVVANKSLTTVNDFKASLDDSVKQRAEDMANLTESMPYKYRAGQMVFTESGAKNNRPPYKILHKQPYGNLLVRGDHPTLGPGKGSVIKDPVTGQAKRTPYEPGYKVRQEIGDEWSEFVIPESAIKGAISEARGGSVKMAGGGLLKAAKAVMKAAEAPKAMKPAFGGAYDDDTLRRAKGVFSSTHGMDYGDALTRDYDFVNINRLVRTEPVNEKRVKELMDAIKNEDRFRSSIPPVIIDSRGGVLDGHHRIEAAKRLGFDSVPALEKYERGAGPKIVEQAQGGAVRMKGGGKAAAVTGGLKAIKELLSDEPLITAAQRAEAGRKAAELIKAQEQIKASEALGQLMEKGVKRTTTTQADRTRVGGGNIGGAAFPAISAADPNYAGKVWGVMDEGTAARLKNLTDPETAWTTMLGSANQLKTNPVVFDKLKRGFISSMKEGNLSDDLAKKINHNLALTFGEGADIRDPKIWQQANTFEKRAALADVMMGQGIAPGKGGVSLGGEKSGKGVIFKPTDILKRETEPTLLHSEHGGDVPTFAAGPRLFKLEKESLYRPDLHPGFPTLIKGEDYGYNIKPTPTEVYLPDWHKRFKEKNPERKGPGYYDLALGVKGEGLPSQELSDAYIRHLLREGFQEGGSVEGNSFAGRLKSALEQNMADGGEVSSDSFASRLKSALEQHMAEGGEVSENTVPDMTDGGEIGYAQGYDNGGAVEPLSAPDAPVAPEVRQMFSKAIAKGQKALEEEYKLLKDPATRADILKRLGLQGLGSIASVPGQLASAIGSLKEEATAPVARLLGKEPRPMESRVGEALEEAMSGDKLIDIAKKRGMIGETEAPVTEFAASLAAPFAVGPAVKAAKAAPTVAKGIVNEMVAPISPRVAQRGAIGWHGTPHKFPPTEKNPLGEFDPTKIGSGEGAQAYGYGHYTAEAPDVAKEYRDKLSRARSQHDVIDTRTNEPLSSDVPGAKSIKEFWDTWGHNYRQGDRDNAIQRWKQDIEFYKNKTIPEWNKKEKELRESGKLTPQIQEFINENKAHYQFRINELQAAIPLLSKTNIKPLGNLYKVDIPDEQVAKMLDLDKPVSEQPFKLQSSVFNDMTNAGYDKAFVNDLLNRKTGMDLYKTLVNGLQQGDQRAVKLAQDLNLGEQGMLMDANALTSQVFKKMGIPGIKYLDEASRAAGKGTRNFVVFPGNESMMNIVERHKRGGLAQAKG